jgi:hypothetical protein
LEVSKKKVTSVSDNGYEQIVLYGKSYTYVSAQTDFWERPKVYLGGEVYLGRLDYSHKYQARLKRSDRLAYLAAA